MMNCAQNSANSIQASRTLIESVTSTATAKNDCAAVRTAPRAGGVDRQAVQTARRDREHDRQGADQQGPLVHLRGDERPRAALVFRRQA